LRFEIEARRSQAPHARPEFTQIGDKIIGSTIWLDDQGEDVERYQVITIRDGKIADMQGCRTRYEAEHVARRS
jgi:hypothetical protein